MPLTLPSSSDDGFDPEFVRDAKVLCSPAHFKHLEAYVEAALRILAQGEVINASQVVEDFVKEHEKLKAQNVARCFRALDILARNVSAGEGITSKDLLEVKSELAADFGGDEQTVARLATVIDTLDSHQKEIARSLRREQIITGLLPMLQSVTVTVDARVVWEEDEPEKPSFVPLASILLELDSGTPDRICFQATPSKLRFLIENLETVARATEAAAKAAKTIA